jgi:hypothetical protein
MTTIPTAPSPGQPEAEQPTRTHVASIPSSESLEKLCQRLNRQITSFLEQDTANEQLRTVQEQTRFSLSVISDALDQYRYAEAGQ